LLSESLKLGDLKNVIDAKNTLLPYYHLNNTLILPEAISKNGLVIEEQCPICKRNGYYYKLTKVNDRNTSIPTGITYSSKQIDNMENYDFFFTWECFGLSYLVASSSNIVGFARPLLIVSEKFKNILEKLKVKGLEFEPVTVK
jgi:hypothetical protein